mgnify:CR=1 FL=1
MNFVIPLLASIVSLIFAATVLDQYFAKGKPYQLIWTMGLLMFFLSMGSAFWIEAWGLNETAYRLWYLLGAVLVAAYLGMGTLYLLARRRVAHTIMAILLVASAYATFAVFTATTDLGAISVSGLSGDAMPDEVRNMTPYFNIFGTLALVGGAIHSAWVFWRRRLMRHRMISSILIAVGTMLPAMGGTLSRFEVSSVTSHALFMLLGVVIIFIGFLRSREIFGLYRFPLIHGFRRVPDD